MKIIPEMGRAHLIRFIHFYVSSEAESKYRDHCPPSCVVVIVGVRLSLICKFS